MQIHLDEKPAESVECDALVAFTFEGKPNDRFKDSLSEVYSSGEVTGKMYEMTLVHRPPGFKAKRVLLAGSGQAEKFTSAELRRVSGAATPRCDMHITVSKAFDLRADLRIAALAGVLR